MALLFLLAICENSRPPRSSELRVPHLFLEGVCSTLMDLFLLECQRRTPISCSNPRSVPRTGILAWTQLLQASFTGRSRFGRHRHGSVHGPRAVVGHARNQGWKLNQKPQKNSVDRLALRGCAACFQSRRFRIGTRKSSRKTRSYVGKGWLEKKPAL